MRHLCIGNNDLAESDVGKNCQHGSVPTSIYQTGVKWFLQVPAATSVCEICDSAGVAVVSGINPRLKITIGMAFAFF
jgi:hypothetical protein